jgi:hypothetical protein
LNEERGWVVLTLTICPIIGIMMGLAIPGADIAGFLEE